jgi:signal transduction histidine kinase
VSSRLITTSFVLTTLGLAIAILLVERSSPDQEAHQTFTALLAERRALDDEIARHALEARFALASNYDQLARDDADRQRLELATPRLLPSFLSPGERSDIRERLESYSALTDQYWRLIERFKSQNALLRNSATYFPTLVYDMLGRTSDPTLDAAIYELHGRTSSLALQNDPTLEVAQEQALATVVVRAQGKVAEPDQRALDLMIAHARAIRVHKRETDSLLKQLLQLPIGPAHEQVEERYQLAYDMATKRRKMFGQFVSALALVLLAIVGHAGLRLRRAAAALNRANEGLEAAVQERTAELEARIAENALMEIELRHAQKLEAVGQLAAGLAHEINTPIQYVGDNLHFLREAFGDVMRLARTESETADISIEFLEAEVPEALDRAMQGAQQVASIVKAMKTFAQTSVDKVPLDLNAELDTTLIVARNEYRYVADVKTELAKIPPVTCNPSGLRQVLLSLIVNAAHAVHDKVGESGIRGMITISTWVQGEQVHISVRDTGTGIPEGIRDRIFEPFFTTKEPGRGSGQGLAIAHSIVQKHDGKLWFETELGIGTTFFVRLPLEPGAASWLERKAS